MIAALVSLVRGKRVIYMANESSPEETALRGMADAPVEERATLHGD